MPRKRYKKNCDPIENGKKLCPKCDKILTLNAFNSSSQRWNGRQLWCKNCGNTAKKMAYYGDRRDFVRKLVLRNLKSNMEYL
jgi:ribosomal protein L37AE/L43A